MVTAMKSLPRASEPAAPACASNPLKRQRCPRRATARLLLALAWEKSRHQPNTLASRGHTAVAQRASPSPGPNTRSLG